MPTQLTLERDLCFIEIIEGEVDSLQRQVCESSFLALLKRSGIVMYSIEICSAGCFAIVGSHDVESLKSVARAFNVAVRVVERCARVAVRRADDDNAIPALEDVIVAFHEESLPIVHVAPNDSEMFVLVRSSEGHQAMAIMHRLRKCSARRVAA